MNVRFGSVVLALLLLSVGACSSGPSHKAEAVCKKGTGANGFLTLCGEGTSLPPCTLGHSYAQLPNCTPPPPSPPTTSPLPRGHSAPAGATFALVPNVAGMSGVQAIHELTKYPLGRGRDLNWHRGYVVVLTSPPAGTRVPVGTVVRLVYGPRGLKCPPISGSRLNKAASLCIVRHSK
jgi:hypothetical protein